jgi:hypothetical protein
MRQRLTVTVLGAVTLASCGSAASEPEQARQPPLEAEPITGQGDRDIFPVEFRGRWASDKDACRDVDQKGIIHITAGRITAYESDAVLLKNSLAFEQTPEGQPANTLLALVAESGEGELGLQTFRLSHSTDRHYFTRDGTSPDQMWSYPLIRCPA